jgi:hypothetical protein
VEQGLLVELLLALAAAAGAAVFVRLGLPTIAGFLAMGALVGAGGLGLAEPERVRSLAELGVVFLLFEIGLELPYERVRHAWRDALSAGALQVVLTFSLVAAGARSRRPPCPSPSYSARWSHVGTPGSGSSPIAARQTRRTDGRRRRACSGPLHRAVPDRAPDTAENRLTPGDVALSVAKLAGGLALLGVAARVPCWLLEGVRALRSRDLFAVVASLWWAPPRWPRRPHSRSALQRHSGGSSPYAHQLFAEICRSRGIQSGSFCRRRMRSTRGRRSTRPAVLNYVVAVAEDARGHNVVMLLRLAAQSACAPA